MGNGPWKHDPPYEILDVDDKVESGKGKRVSVRQLLSWFGYQRRGWRQARLIRACIEEYGLTTHPDFESANIDSIIRFKRAVTPSAATDARVQMQTQAPAEAKTDECNLVAEKDPRNAVAIEIVAEQAIADPFSAGNTAMSFVLADPTQRVRLLAAADSPPTSIRPDASVEYAVSLMLQNDFSQLPVMASPRDVRGMVTWETLGSRMHLGGRCEVARDVMTQHQEIPADASLLDAVQIIARHQSVLVRGDDQTITGIVTASDISLEFRKLAEPFFLLGEIENQIRNRLAARLSIDEIRAARDPRDSDRQVSDAADLTFGEYRRLVENPSTWQKLAMRIDRKIFIDDLSKVHEIRNDVMHFNPDPLPAEGLELLRRFARLLDRLRYLQGD